MFWNPLDEYLPNHEDRAHRGCFQSSAARSKIWDLASIAAILAAQSGGMGSSVREYAHIQISGIGITADKSDILEIDPKFFPTI